MAAPKRIVLSRKGFDSTRRYGGMPSPIIDGRLLSLPIPEDKKRTTPYSDLSDPYGNFPDLGPIVEQLTHRRIRADRCAHLDPDLRKSSLKNRPRGWRPIFGQVDQAQTHLCNQEVTLGDLFLFYGLYRDATINERSIEYAPGAPRKHVIWGWMSIGEILKISSENDGPAWARYHPHFTDKRGANNTVYIASDTVFGTLPGAGVFEIYSTGLCLTDPAQKKPSRWKLPAWFAPRNGQYSLTYHPRKEWWTTGTDCVFLKTKSPGQEFVLNTTNYPEALQWAEDLVRSNSKPRDLETLKP